MRAFSCRAPWWWYILHGGKDIENRNWATGVRGTVYLHASKTIPRGEYAEDVTVASCIAMVKRGLMERPRLLEMQAAGGCLVGQVDVVDCVTSSSSPWFAGIYGWVLRNPVAFDQPVPAKGALGWFEVPVIGETRGAAAGQRSLFGEGA